MMTYSAKDPNGPMSGESLRARHNSEVVQLMAKRSLQMASFDSRSTMDVFGCMDALSLGHCLAKWDLSAGATCLKTVCSQSLAAATRFNNPGYAASNASRMGPMFGQAITDRSKAKDGSAAADYAKLCEMIDPNYGMQDIQFLRPLWEAQNDAGLRSVGERLMAQWTKDLSSDNPRISETVAETTTELLPSTPLLGTTYYREFLIHGLQTSRQIGTAQMGSGTRSKVVSYKLAAGGGGSWNLPQNEDSGSLAGKGGPMSVSDYFAQKLANGFVKGVPSFFVLWPESKRAEAKAAIVEWLKDNSRDWTAIEKSSGFYQMFTR
jgi:hypothetical protein